LSHQGRVKTAAAQKLAFLWRSPFAADFFLHPVQRPSLRGLDGEFWPAGELIPIGLRLKLTGVLWRTALRFSQHAANE
jgi:hypothetical protein